jgi:hypothetical protein
MRFAMKLGSLFLILLGSAEAGAFQAPSCSPEQSVIAEAKVSRAQAWDEIYRDFRSLPGCTRVNVVEVWSAYTAAVSRLFVNDWASFGSFSSLALRDKVFQKFVIAHVSDPTNLQGDLVTIRRHAQTECPAHNRELCKKIAAATGQ